MKGILTDTETGELLVAGRALVIGDCAGQVIQDVLLANRGEYKEHPLIGAELQKMINGTPDPFWNSDVKKMLQVCGVKVDKVSMNGNEIIIE